MAKKKNNTKNEDNKSSFDLEKFIQELEIPNFTKAGFEYYLKVSEVKINNEKDVEKAYKKFMES